MAKTMKLAMFVGGCATAGLVAVAAGAPPARAAGKKNALIIQSDNVAGASGVPANQIVQITFNQPINPATVSPATLRVRARNATQTGYTKQVFGSYQVVGNIVRFYPRLPTHMRDATGKFYPSGSAQDDASANAGFKPSTAYEVRVMGQPAVTTVRSTSGRALSTTRFMQFSTAPVSPPDRLWTTTTYTDNPPPEFDFSNPPDAVPSALGQYATHGGVQDVQSDIIMSLFCTKVPLAPGTVRDAGNVEATMIARRGDYSLRRPVAGTPYIEQNFDTTLVAYQPRVALADVGTFSVRVGKAVKDLTELHDFAPNRERERLNRLYVYFASARSLSPSTPIAQLPEPPDELAGDWPAKSDTGGRGILKTNLLALGDLYPDEIDPRTMLIFTTRDELATTDSITIEFTKAENLLDTSLSIGTLDQDVPGGAAAVFTASGGSGVLGDLTPTGNITISQTTIAANGGVLNYRNVVIPNGVTVTIAGSAQPNQGSPPATPNPVNPAKSMPVAFRCLTFQLDGQISADGVVGLDGNSAGNYTVSSTVPQPPVPGGPGGGFGAGSSADFTTTVNVSGTGGVGNNVSLVDAPATDGGRGGQGGKTGTVTTYTMASGGGGGGGSRTAGQNGATATVTTTSYQNSWAGVGGQGGAAATGNADLANLVGGAGGGGGGKAQSYTQSGYYWGTSGASGGGGGGALMIQTAGILSVGTAGVIHADGGKGGTGVLTTYTGGGGGGGGGGGALLLRSSRGFNLTSAPTNLRAAGGAGGTPRTSSYGTGGIGGTGGNGFIKLEDPNGGLTITGLTQAGGVYNPVGGGVPSYLALKWVDLGVQDPRIMGWKSGDVVTITQNDAIYVQAQMTRESPTLFGKPDVSAIKSSDQGLTNTTVMSQWVPIKVHDLTGIVGGAFTATLGAIPGYPANPPTEYASFDISALNGKGYRFIRFRMYFQLDASQSATSPLPYVDRIITTYQYNF